MISPSLEREVRARLNHARVMAEASAGQVQIARTHPGTRMPTLAGPSTLDRLLAALGKVTSDRQARRWLTWADEWDDLCDMAAKLASALRPFAGTDCVCDDGTCQWCRAADALRDYEDGDR